MVLVGLLAHGSEATAPHDAISHHQRSSSHVSPHICVGYASAVLGVAPVSFVLVQLQAVGSAEVAAAGGVENVFGCAGRVGWSSTRLRVTFQEFLNLAMQGRGGPANELGADTWAAIDRVAREHPEASQLITDAHDAFVREHGR